MTTWRTTRLGDDHRFDWFDCGVPSLDNWLTDQARRAQRAGTARTWVWTPPARTNVVAYYSICPTQIERVEVGSSMAGGYSTVPAYLLARLALDEPLQGHGLGSQLLIDALERIVDAAGTAGGRLIVVNAIDKRAARFYEHHDFRAIRKSPSRLVMKVATAAKALGR